MFVSFVRCKNKLGVLSFVAMTSTAMAPLPANLEQLINSTATELFSNRTQDLFSGVFYFPVGKIRPLSPHDVEVCVEESFKKRPLRLFFNKSILRKFRRNFSVMSYIKDTT